MNREVIETDFGEMTVESPGPSKGKPQQTRDLIVEGATTNAKLAESHLREAIEWITIIQPAQHHQSLLTELRQFVEEVEKLS